MSHEFRPAVEARGLSVRYGAREVWRDAEFSLGRGQFAAVLGPNGAGKSTLVRLLLGLQRPAAGSLLVLGHAPRRGDPSIGYVPQRRSSDTELTIRGRDFVGMGVDGHRWGVRMPWRGRDAIAEAVADVIDAVGARAYADRSMSELSGGEQQRLVLAQALVGRPELLVLDEPFASLDMASQMAVTRLLGRLSAMRGFAVVLVTHDVNPLLSTLDEVIYIANGRVMSGPVESVVTTENLSALYDAPVEVLRDSRGRLFVVGVDDDIAHSHGPGVPGDRLVGKGAR